MKPQVISVTEFVNIINETLAFAYPEVIIEGEVSSFKVNQGRWVFFDLKDQNNTISCFMTVYQLKLPLEDGMKVRITGAPKVTKFSKFSVTVRAVELAGEGELKRAMELLRRKLEAEGLFDPARKRSLPAFPARIGLVTSGTSAAYADFIKVLSARFGGMHILLADVSVQGAAAPDQIVGALTYFNQLPEPVDVLVLIRGGGSLEDLMAFSTEPVARAVAASRTPIIVGVGHEIDFSLADYAADVRAATPTDAARLVVPDRAEILARVEHIGHRTEAALSAAIDRRITAVGTAISRLESYLRHPRERVDQLLAGLTRGLDRLGHGAEARQQQVRSYERVVASYERVTLPQRHARLVALARLLTSVDPAAVLARGYAIVRTDAGVLKDPSLVSDGDALMLQLAQGHLDAKVDKRPS